MSPPGTLFCENQRFIGRAPAQALLVMCALAFAVVAYIDLGDSPSHRGGWLPLLVLAGLGVGLSWLFASLELTVRVLADQVDIRLAPLARRVIPLAEIAGCEPCRYRPMRDYGGWGLRGNRSGRAYTVSGDRGVRLHLVGGERILIGSQQPEPLCAAIVEAGGNRLRGSH